MLPVGGANAEVWMGVRRMWRDVKRGLGAGADGEMWWRKRVAAGPDDSSTG